MDMVLVFMADMVTRITVMVAGIIVLLHTDHHIDRRTGQIDQDLNILYLSRTDQEFLSLSQDHHVLVPDRQQDLVLGQLWDDQVQDLVEECPGDDADCIV
jgi:hypothetical protein